MLYYDDHAWIPSSEIIEEGESSLNEGSYEHFGLHAGSTVAVGTSVEENAGYVLIRVREVVSWNDLSPGLKVANFGRSNILNQLTHTLENHIICIRKRVSSCSNCS